MKVRNAEASPIYQETYRALVAASKNRTQATALNYSKVYKHGLKAPMDTLYVMQMAKRDYNDDVLLHGKMNKYKRKLNNFKTKFSLIFNPEYRKTKRDFMSALKTDYPKSYKKRINLINQDKVAIYSNTIPIDRLSKLKIKEL